MAIIDHAVPESVPADEQVEPLEEVEITRKPAIEQGLAIAAVVACVLSGVVVVAAARRGLGVSDEGLYLLMTDDPERALRSASGFHVLLNPFFELTGRSPVVWRLVRAVVDVGSDLIFALALLHFLRARSPEAMFSRRHPGIALVAGVTLFGFTSWAWMPNGFGYNELGSVMSTLLAATLLVLVAKPHANGQRLFVPAAIIGVLLVPAAITRWPSAFAIFFGVLVVLALSMTKSKVLALLATILSGAALSALVIHVAVLDLGSIIGGIQSGTSDVASDTHSSGSLLVTYGRSVGFAALSLPFFGVALVPGLLGLRRWRTGESPALTPWLMVLFGGFLTIYFGRLLGGTRLRMLNDWGGVPLAMGLVLAGVCAFRIRASDGLMTAARSVMLPLVLVAIPIGSSAGTDNPLMLNSIILAELWIGAIIILAAQFSFSGKLGSFVAAGLLVLAAGVPLMIYESLHGTQYWFVGPQDSRVERGNFAGLDVDDVTHELLNDLEDLRLTLEPNPTVISLWHRPAVTYALGGHGIGFPWYTTRAFEASAATIDGACSEDGFEPTDQVVFVTEVVEPEEMGPVHGALSRCGIDFPADFSFVTTLTSPLDLRDPTAVLELQVFVSQ